MKIRTKIKFLVNNMPDNTLAGLPGAVGFLIGLGVIGDGVYLINQEVITRYTLGALVLRFPGFNYS